MFNFQQDNTITLFDASTSKGGRSMGVAAVNDSINFERGGNGPYIMQDDSYGMDR